MRRAALAVALLLAGCDPDGPEDGAAPEALPDTLTTAEQTAFAVDVDRYPEMSGGRLDTVDMTAETADGAWHVQALNYASDFIAMTYATWYTGPDSVAILAADGQPRLEDELGNVYHGIVIPHNPRFRVETGTTAVGVYVFSPAVHPQADSLTLFVNDSTPPVLRVGPFGVRHTPAAGGSSGIEVRPSDE